MIAERRHGGSGLDAQLAPLRAVFVGGIHGGLAPWDAAKMEIIRQWLELYYDNMATIFMDIFI